MVSGVRKTLMKVLHFFTFLPQTVAIINLRLNNQELTHNRMTLKATLHILMF